MPGGELYKNDSTNRDVVWVVESGGSKEQFIRCESRSHQSKGQFLREKLCPSMPEDTLL